MELIINLIKVTIEVIKPVVEIFTTDDMMPYTIIIIILSLLFPKKSKKY